jgi:hypothetical protein
VSLLEVLASEKRFRRPNFGFGTYWFYDSGGHIRPSDWPLDVVTLGEDLTREDVFALDWEIEE